MISFPWLLRLAHLSPPPSTSFHAGICFGTALRCRLGAADRNKLAVRRISCAKFLGKVCNGLNATGGSFEKASLEKRVPWNILPQFVARSHVLSLSRSFNPRRLGMWTQFSRVILFALLSLRCKLCVGKGYSASARRPKCR